MSATSLHKLGGSLTQSSILNVREGRVNPQRVQAILSMLTTTSTSYLLLASLDAARKQLALHGREMNEKALHLARWAREALNQIPGIYCFGDERVGEEAIYDYDPTKLTIHVRELGITGYEAEKWLREMHNIEVELSDLYNVLCFITAGDSEETVEASWRRSATCREPFTRNGPRASFASCCRRSRSLLSRRATPFTPKRKRCPSTKRWAASCRVHHGVSPGHPHRHARRDPHRGKPGLHPREPGRGPSRAGTRRSHHPDGQGDQNAPRHSVASGHPFFIKFSEGNGPGTARVFFAGQIQQQKSSPFAQEEGTLWSVWKQYGRLAHVRHSASRPAAPPRSGSKRRREH